MIKSLAWQLTLIFRLLQPSLWRRARTKLRLKLKLAIIVWNQLHSLRVGTNTDQTQTRQYKPMHSRSLHLWIRIVDNPHLVADTRDQGQRGRAESNGVKEKEGIGWLLLLSTTGFVGVRNSLWLEKFEWYYHRCRCDRRGQSMGPRRASFFPK